MELRPEKPRQEVFTEYSTKYSAEHGKRGLCRDPGRQHWRGPEQMVPDIHMALSTTIRYKLLAHRALSRELTSNTCLSSNWQAPVAHTCNPSYVGG
jgi:hypothetical protein